MLSDYEQEETGDDDDDYGADTASYEDFRAYMMAHFAQFVWSSVNPEQKEKILKTSGISVPEGLPPLAASDGAPEKGELN